MLGLTAMFPFSLAFAMIAGPVANRKVSILEKIFLWPYLDVLRATQIRLSNQLILGGTAGCWSWSIGREMAEKKCDVPIALLNNGKSGRKYKDISGPF